MIINMAYSGGGGDTTLDDVDVLLCDFSTFTDVTVLEGNMDSNTRQITA